MGQLDCFLQCVWCEPQKVTRRLCEKVLSLTPTDKIVAQKAIIYVGLSYMPLRRFVTQVTKVGILHEEVDQTECDIIVIDVAASLIKYHLLERTYLSNLCKIKLKLIEGFKKTNRMRNKTLWPFKIPFSFSNLSKAKTLNNFKGHIIGQDKIGASHE